MEALQWVSLWGEGLGLCGLFLEADDAPIFIGFDDAELAGSFGGGNFDGGDGDFGAGIDVALEHFGVVHFVDVVAGKNENVFGALAAEGIDVLVDGVRGALIPLLGDAHLRRQDFDKFTETHERRPSGADVARKAEGFILRENEDAMETGVDAIGKRDVNDAIESAERDGRLGAIASEGPEPLALSSSEKYTDGIAHIGHGGRLPRQEFFAAPV